MEELKFVPSEAVWLEVQKQIRQRKDRRRLLLWWLLLPLLAGGSFGVYNIYHKKNTDTSLSSIQPTTAPAVTKTGAATQTVSGNTPVSSGKEKEQALPVDRQTGTTDNTTAASNNNDNHPNTTNHHTMAADHNDNRVGTHTPRFTNRPARQAHSRKGRTSGVQQGVTTRTDNNKTDSDQIAQNDITPAAGEQPAIAGHEPADLKPAAVTAPGRPLWAAAVNARPEEEAAKKPIAPKKKMEWVVTANAGAAGITAGFSPFVQSTAALDVAYSGNNFMGSPSNSSSGASQGASSPLSRKPSEIKPDFSGGLGLSLRRYVSNTFSLEAGFVYNYYSTSMMVGKKNDSSTTVRQGQQDKAVSEYYSNTSITSSTQNVKYTNYYHFIEIPIRAQKQLGLRSPFSIQAGMSIGRMLGSNALQYDATKNIYYKDNRLFNKTQLTFSLGMDIRLLRNRPVSVELGPRLQYGLTNFTRKEYYGNRHLLFAGLETRIFFRKK